MRTSLGKSRENLISSTVESPLRIKMSSSENSITPLKHETPCTGHLRQRLEQQWKQKLENSDSVTSKTSPTLDKLRMTPGRVHQDKETLMTKHHHTRQNADRLKLGGGVSLWPDMEDMRLSGKEAIQLSAICTTLFFLMILLFYKLHGEVIQQVKHFINTLQHFDDKHPIHLVHGQEMYVTSLKAWHNDHRQLLDVIQKSFDVSAFPLSYAMYIMVYGIGMGTLVFYLADNVLSQNKMSPRRIKRWTCLLTVIGTWTCALAYMLTEAYLLELMVQRNIYKLAEHLGEAINSNLDLHYMTSIVEYWRTRCLTPSPAILTVMGFVYVRDVIFYLQYYLVPVITVLGTPVVKLIVSIYHVYQIKHE